jgi:hypothetical protein
MKISHWMLAIALTATAWAPASAKLSVGTITPVKPEKTAKEAHPEKAQPHAGKAEAVHVEATKAPAAHVAAKKAPAAHAAEHKAAESKKAAKKVETANSADKQESAGKEKEKKGGAEADTSAPRLLRKHNRDPFVSPIVERPAGVKCTGTGRQCLFVGDVRLQGVVESSGSFIAVVASGIHTYFLRDKDPLADGEVVRITRDAIIMRQRSSDELNRPVEREVTKKLGGPPA